MLQIELVPITAIRPYENNAKIHTPEQIEQIKKSILEFGNNDPIAIDGDPRYVDVIIQRWEEQTGKKARLLTE